MGATNSLGAYFDTKNVLRRADVAATPSVEESSTEASGSRAIELLTSSELPATMPVWLGTSGWSVSEFAQAVEALRKANLIEVSKEGDHDLVRLTELGQALLPD